VATWEDLGIESGSDKDEAEDEANVVVGLVATVASDAESGTDSKDENEVYSKHYLIIQQQSFTHHGSKQGGQCFD
jgi:hypothetical protein